MGSFSAGSGHAQLDSEETPTLYEAVPPGVDLGPLSLFFALTYVRRGWDVYEVSTLWWDAEHDPAWDPRHDARPLTSVVRGGHLLCLRRYDPPVSRGGLAEAHAAAVSRVRRGLPVD